MPQEHGFQNGGEVFGVSGTEFALNGLRVQVSGRRPGRS
jgi:hypothetical protein